MKATLTILVFMATTHFALAEPEVSLTITVSTNRFELLQPVVVSAVLSSATDRSVQLGRRGLLLDYGVVVEMDGKAVPDTVFARWQLRQSADMGDYAYQLVSGKPETCSVPVNQLCDMTLPGRYTVRLSKRVAFREGNKSQYHIIESNVIEVIVQRSWARPFRKDSAQHKSGPYP